MTFQSLEGSYLKSNPFLLLVDRRRAPDGQHFTLIRKQPGGASDELKIEPVEIFSTIRNAPGTGGGSPGEQTVTTTSDQ